MEGDAGLGGVLGEVVQGAGAVGDGLQGDAVAGEQGAGQGDGAADGALAGQGFALPARSCSSYPKRDAWRIARCGGFRAAPAAR